MNRFCRYCGKEVEKDTIFCPHCKLQISEYNIAEFPNNPVSSPPPVAPIETQTVKVKPKNKWIALLLCVFTLCGHKFYEGKIGMGFLYLVTVGLFGIGWIFDIFSILSKPTYYYVK